MSDFKFLFIFDRWLEQKKKKNPDILSCLSINYHFQSDETSWTRFMYQAAWVHSSIVRLLVKNFHRNSFDVSRWVTVRANSFLFQSSEFFICKIYRLTTLNESQYTWVVFIARERGKEQWRNSIIVYDSLHLSRSLVWLKQTKSTNYDKKKIK